MSEQNLSTKEMLEKINVAHASGDEQSLLDLAKLFNKEEIIWMLVQEVDIVLKHYNEVREVLKRFVPAFNNQNIKLNNINFNDDDFNAVKNDVRKIKDALNIE